MNLHPTVSVIMPCYNEGSWILPVLREVKKSKLVNEIVIVDDGSNSITKEVLNHIDGVRIITKPHNMGKSAAMKTGVLASKSDYIAFVDSDLNHFTVSNLDSLIEPVLAGKCDLTLSDREKETWYSRLSCFSIAYTGERVISRQLLMDNINVFDHYNYLVEASMNRRFFGNVRIAKVKLPGVSQKPKNKKIGIIAGYYHDLKMLSAIIKFLGLKKFIQQLIYSAELEYC